MLVKYIDDFNCVTASDLGAAQMFFSENRTQRLYRAVKCERIIQRICENAQLIGMRVNSSKTQLLSVSTDNSCNKAYLVHEGEKIESGSCLKVLGFSFDSRPTVHKQVEQTVKKFYRQLWTIIHLKQAGLPTKDLVDLYKVFLRPIVEYCSAIIQPMITSTQSDQLEALQARCLRTIFGFNVSYTRCLELSDLPLLSTRRRDYTDRFARKAEESDRFSGWFRPITTRSSARVGLKYEEPRRRLERTKKNPIDYYTRRLNDLR